MKTIKATVGTIRVIVKEPGGEFTVRMIPNTLEYHQKLVGGYIETVSIGQGILLVCNEEGIMQDLPKNIRVGHAIIRGTIFFCKVRGAKFASLSDSEITEIVVRTKTHNGMSLEEINEV